MYKIITNLFITEQLSRQEASSAVIYPAIVIVSAYAGLFLDAYVLLLPLVMAAVYEMVVSTVKMAMTMLYTFNPRHSFDPTEAHLAILQSIFKGYAAQMRRNPVLSFAREACVIFFCFLMFLVSIFQISEIARKEREMQQRQYESIRDQQRRIVLDFPSDNEDGVINARIAISPPTYSMAIRNEGVRQFAPELCITEDTAPPSYSALVRDRTPPVSLVRTPPSTVLPHPQLATHHSAGMIVPPTYSTPAIARIEPPPS
ncbi:hypothetical protein PENTCL1PPCAC_2838, partial [Pristionchus entomophagus]